MFLILGILITQPRTYRIGSEKEEIMEREKMRYKVIKREKERKREKKVIKRE